MLNHFLLSESSGLHLIKYYLLIHTFSALSCTPDVKRGELLSPITIYK